MNALALLLRFAAPFKWRAALAVLLGLLTIGANVGLLGTAGYLIASAALRPETVLLLWVPIVGVRFFGISRGVFRYLERLVSHDLTFRILSRLRVWLYDRVERSPGERLEERRSGDLLSALVGDVDTLQNFYLRVLLPSVVALLALPAIYFAVRPGSPPIAAVLTAFLAAAGIGVPLLGSRHGRKHGEETAQVRAAMHADIADALSGMGDLLVYGRERDVMERIEARQEQLSRSQTRLGTVGSLTGGGMLLAGGLAMWVVLLLAIPPVVHRELAGPVLPALVLMATAAFEAVIPLPQALQTWRETRAAASRLLEIGREAEMPSNQAAPARGDTPERSDTLDVRFANAGFRYAPDEPEAIRGFTLAIPPRRKIAVVGESGGGKSTVVELLAKRRESYGGSIRINRKELRQLPAEWVRAHLAVVPQQPYFFNHTVAENLRIAKPDATDEELAEAARIAQIHERIVQLPDGYRTIIGEFGERLSGGERQRLALARAILRRAPLLVLDEPTAGLDALTERAFRQAMRERLRDCSILWITHRLAGLEEMDEIVVMRNGAIVEQGAYAELMARKGVFSVMKEIERETF